MVAMLKQKLSLHQEIKINYPIYFSENLFSKQSNFKELRRLCSNKPLLVVIDKNVSKIYGKLIKNSFNSFNHQVSFLNLDATEKNKNIQSILKLSNRARSVGLRRDSLFVAVGGGITLDMVGLAAFLYRRRINYIRIPTTLVGMIDAGVGIKVGVNFENSKNFLGGYYPPLAVFSDQNFLSTISEKEIKSGLYEMLKMAIILDLNLFKMIDNNHKNFTNKKFNKKTLEIIRASSYLMLQELEGNLYEKILKRKVDFGHTFSPYFETNSDFNIPHGQAVGIDILISSLIAFQRKLIPENEFNRILKMIYKIGFSKKYKLPPVNKIYASLNEIKKHRAGNLNLVLPNTIGSCVFTNKCSFNEIKAATSFLRLSNIFR